ncbi:MAG: hypothetical protein G01um10147_1139 [Microgenomates group bacterium Gr01-1014_7]|nr:MAG: hypothetical protein G01um10147_1139 [Microgenomates group bacterium Gr01-1014_7]
MFTQENQLVSSRIKKIAKDVKSNDPEADCYKSALLFLSKDNALLKGLAWIQVYPKKPAEKGFEFDLPQDFDYPIYSLNLRPEDFGGDFVPPDATILDPNRIMWVDRNYRMCNYSYIYLFTEEGRSILINHAYEDDFPMDEDEISPAEAFYMIDLDVIEREFS